MNINNILMKNREFLHKICLYVKAFINNLITNHFKNCTVMYRTNRNQSANRGFRKGFIPRRQQALNENVVPDQQYFIAKLLMNNAELRRWVSLCFRARAIKLKQIAEDESVRLEFKVQGITVIRKTNATDSSNVNTQNLSYNNELFVPAYVAGVEMFKQNSLTILNEFWKLATNKQYKDDCPTAEELEEIQDDAMSLSKQYKGE